MFPLASTQAIAVSVAGLLAGSALAAWGGVMIGAPEKAFLLRAPLLIRSVDMRFYGVISYWMAGAATIVGSGIGTAIGVGPRIGDGLAILCALLVVGVGIASTQKAREYSDETHKVFDHY